MNNNIHSIGKDHLPKVTIHNQHKESEILENKARKIATDFIDKAKKKIRKDSEDDVFNNPLYESHEAISTNIYVKPVTSRISNSEISLIKQKGYKDGELKSFEGSDILVEGVNKTIYNSAQIIEEMTRFISTRSKIFSESLFDFSIDLDESSYSTKDTFNGILNNLERDRNKVEMTVGKMDKVQANNYRYARHAIENEDISTDKRFIHEQIVKAKDTQVYRETREKYGQIINYLREEIRQLEAVKKLIKSDFEYHLERISIYWNSAKENYQSLPVAPPTKEELLIMMAESLYGEIEELVAKKQLELRDVLLKRERLRPENLIHKIFHGYDF